MDTEKIIKESMVNQPVINIGFIGSSSNGKSTIVYDITGESTQRHSDEILKNLSIKLGYANAKIYKCNTCNKPECYQSTPSSVYNYKCNICNNECVLVNHVSFIDCPGHNLLMATMLNGTSVMDYNILVESAVGERIPQLQTIEHFEVTNESNIPTSFICLNKMDQMVKNKLHVSKIVERIETFTKMYNKENIPIIPISGTLKINIDVVLEYISNMKIPKRDLNSHLKMLIIRSFDVNKEKTPIKDLKGGIIGGSIMKGIIKLNDEFNIYPGYVENENNIWYYKPLKTRALSISSNKNNLQYAIPGSSIGVQLDIDPSLTGDDELIGNVIYGIENKNVYVYHEITLKYKKTVKKMTEFMNEYIELNKNNKIKINANANNIESVIKTIDEEYMTILLDKPICLEIGDVVTISKIKNNSKDIIIYGKGVFINGEKCVLL